MSTEAEEAAAALAAMQGSRERLAAVSASPPLRHLAFAALLGAMVAAQAAPGSAPIFIETMLILGVVGLVTWDRKRTGMFVSGYRAGKTLPLTIGLVVFAVADALASIWLKDSHGIGWAPLAGGLIGAVVAFVVSLVWERVWLGELRQTP